MCIYSGVAALAYAVVLGQREKTHKDEEFKPHNMANVFLGTGFIWFGWFGFNGGSGIELIQKENPIKNYNLVA